MKKLFLAITCFVLFTPSLGALENEDISPVERIVHRLFHSSYSVRYRAIRQLHKMGPRAVEATTSLASSAAPMAPITS